MLTHLVVEEVSKIMIFEKNLNMVNVDDKYNKIFMC